MNITIVLIYSLAVGSADSIISFSHTTLAKWGLIHALNYINLYMHKGKFIKIHIPFSLQAAGPYPSAM
jgi:hypothetical protein